MRTLTLFAASMLLATSVNAQSMAGKPFLSVQGHAETRIKPDIFPLEVTIAETSMDPAKSQALVEDLARKALAAAAKQRVEDRDIEIGNLSISPETEYDDDTDTTKFLGNTYERKITVRFRSLDSLRAFLGDLPASKHVKFATETFEYSKQAELKRQLRREAIEDARRGAEDMAAAVGKRLVELQNVSDRAQSTVYSASGFNAGSLDTVRVVGGYIRSADIVLREGEIKVSAEAYLIYVIGD